MRPNAPAIFEGIPSSWMTPPPSTTISAPKKVNHSKHIASGAVNPVPIGRCGNAFGLIGGVYQSCWADPRIHTVSFVHRSDPATNTSDNSTGFLRYDYSTDEGATFPSGQLNVGPLFSPNGDPQGEPFSVARYPQGGIYNPAGNTIADSAYITYFAPLRDNTNGNATSMTDWGGVGYGVSQIASASSTAHKDSSNNGFFYIIPSGFTITQSGTTYGIEGNIDETSGSGIYQDNLILSKGTFNTSTHDISYNRTLVSAPVDVDNNGTKNFAGVNIGFAPDGMTGYIVIMGHQDYTYVPDSIFHPIIYKTIDGGATWHGPKRLKMDNVASLLNNASASGKYVTSFSVDLVVDNNGNCHFIVPVFAESNGTSSILIGAGNWGMFDVYTMDGGASWLAHLLATPETFSATFGAGTSTDPTITEYTRGQASSTWDGTKLFFTWYDTDTTVNGSAAGNATPDMHSVGYNTVNHTWTPDTNFTANTNAGGLVTFGLVSEYVFTPTGYYNIPSVFNELSSISNTGTATQLYYIQNASFTDANFTVPPMTNVVYLQDSGSALGITEETANQFQLNTFPNPTNNTVQVSYVLDKATPVTIEIYNILGERISTMAATLTLGAGAHTTTLNVSNLSNGIYMIKTTFGDSVVISKLTKI